MKQRLLSTALIMLALTISACSSNSNKSSNKPSGDISSLEPTSSEEEDPPIIDNSGFKGINDEEPFEIHTEAQKEFLEYDGNYAKMPKTLFPDGTKHLSDSLPITLTWNYELPEGKELQKYSVIFGQKKDLSDGYQVDGGVENDTISFSPQLRQPHLGPPQLYIALG